MAYFLPFGGCHVNSVQTTEIPATFAVHDLAHSTYYRAPVFGEVTLTDGVNDLIRGEQAFDTLYNSASASERSDR
ncbi:ArsR family transcriptional regulator [Halococcus thailandensis JCM 13552]|uniref:ArsR family transcriptional regulator n=1 Tax=Halococcus thailandensis JCM 13552 TaxID=1227457 RepID=M0N2X3_9EURY|nr:ArsR family transcriptional regulator [Halococcus thailandensis JCM 13552]